MFSFRSSMFIVLLFLIQCTREITPQDQRTGVQPYSGANVAGAYKPGANLNVMFVGNSLTYENNLPELVKEIAAMDGVTIANTVLAQPNYSFDDHLGDGTVQRTLKANPYDFLIGQQGPSALPESQALLMSSSVNLANECSLYKTKFCLYMVWPALSRDFDRENCILSYTNAATASGALLCPAGLAWKLAWQKDAGLPLYGPDNFHPSMHGSVLAAMVIYATIKRRYNLDFIDKSKASWGGEISDQQFATMKEAAIRSLKQK